MKLSKLSYAVVVASLMAAGAAQAAVTTTGSVAFTSDYKFRGISQSNTNAAVQGSVTVAHDSGVYFTAWGSSIANVNGGLELDTLLGYAGTAGDIGYDVGVMRYNYPGNDGGQTAVTNFKGNGELSYNEVYASVSAKGAKLGVNYSDDYFGETGKFTYVYATYAGEVYNGFGVVASVGLNSLEGAAEQSFITGSSSNDDSYIDYKVGVTKSFEGIGFELAYIGTDIKRSEQGAAELGESIAVLTATKTF